MESGVASRESSRGEVLIATRHVVMNFFPMEFTDYHGLSSWQFVKFVAKLYTQFRLSTLITSEQLTKFIL